MPGLAFVKVILMAISGIGILVGISWSIIDRKFDYNTLLIICCIILFITFNI